MLIRKDVCHFVPCYPVKENAWQTSLYCKILHNFILLCNFHMIKKERGVCFRAEEKIKDTRQGFLHLYQHSDFTKNTERCSKWGKKLDNWNGNFFTKTPKFLCSPLKT